MYTELQDDFGKVDLNETSKSASERHEEDDSCILKLLLEVNNVQYLEIRRV